MTAPVSDRQETRESDRKRFKLDKAAGP